MICAFAATACRLLGCVCVYVSAQLEKRRPQNQRAMQMALAAAATPQQRHRQRTPTDAAATILIEGFCIPRLRCAWLNACAGKCGVCAT